MTDKQMAGERVTVSPNTKLQKLGRSFEKYGSFSESGDEFVITRPDTPRPWINYLTNGKFCVLLSQCGGGFSFLKDSSVNRLTRWQSQNYMSDTPGFFLYLRDEKSGSYWNANHRPVGRSDSFECRHGLGYSVLTSSQDKIATKMTYFVPSNGDGVLVWRIAVTNQDKTERRLKAYDAVEWMLGDWAAELGIRNIAALMNRGAYLKNKEMILVQKMPWGNKPWPHVGFMVASRPVTGFDLDYENFMGRYGDWSAPESVVNGRCRQDAEVTGVPMVGVMEHSLVLAPGETASWDVVVGIADNAAAASTLATRYKSASRSTAALAETRAFWQHAIRDNIEVETPEADVNLATNVWLKYQVYMNNYWGRSCTYYHEGFGEFGYRNTAQDAWAMVPLDPDYARARLIKLLTHQRKSGQPLPGWSEVSGPTTHRPPSDFPMWLPLLLDGYLRETGDMAFLKKKLPFFDGGSATVYDHVRRAIRFLQDVAKSRRGLPLMGTQDWNDAFDRAGIGGKGESVWLGMGLCVALGLMEKIALRCGDKATARDSRRRYEQMSAVINRYAWDGQWYTYGFNDKGQPLGSRKTKEGSVQLNAQTWAIIAGLPDEKKLKSMLAVIDGRLTTEHGPALFDPPYTKYDGSIGRITAFAPGTKENAALFCHGGAFKIYADLLIGRSQEAHDTLRTLLPMGEKDIELFKTEPYVLPEYLIGRLNPRFGEGAFSWLTGSADWLLLSITERMLGVRPEFDGLAIEPVLPPSWKKCRVRRRFRGVLYDITILNPSGRSGGRYRLVVDGEPLEGNVVPVFKDKKTHIVVATHA